MTRLMSVVLAGVILGSVGFAARVEAGDRDRDRDRREFRHRRGDDRDRRGSRFGPSTSLRARQRDRYFVEREVRVIREYYRPHHRGLPRGLRHRYYRTGYLPHGWAKRIRPIPVYLERELIVLPHGYHRGIIDGHAVIYNSRGMIIDIAVLF